MSTMPRSKYTLPIQPFIHGQYVDSRSSERLTILSAIDGSVVSKDLQCANAEDVEIAVESAAEGLKAWTALGAAKRGAALLRFADLMQKNREQLGRLETICCGKPLAFTAKWEVEGAADLFRYFAGYSDKFEGESHPLEDGFLRIVQHEPLGICAAINAFNSPIFTFAMKVAPALAVGNVMISKASEMNPFSTLFLGELAIEAGIPPGVLNILVGTAKVGQALSSHMKIRKISFTGSIAVGKKIQVAATQSNLKRVTLELGGKSPVIIFQDADLASAIECAGSFLTLNGQGCVLGTRIYVHETLADHFIGGLKQMVEGYGSTLGSDPYDSNTMSAPMFHARQKESVLKHFERGKTEATLLTGGNAWGDAKGCFVQPTLFTNPKPNANIVSDEIFGPVAVIDTFQTEEEVLAKANATEYGLGAAVHTNDLSRAIRVAAALEAGTVTVNTAMSFHPTVPFGGFKSSGVGRENGKYVLSEYTQAKSIIIKIKPSDS